MSTQIAETALGGSVAPGVIPEQIASFAAAPTHDEIARRAYALYEARGGEPGHAQDDWLQAERELRAMRADGMIDELLAEGRYATV